MPSDLTVERAWRNRRRGKETVMTYCHLEERSDEGSAHVPCDAMAAAIAAASPAAAVSGAEIASGRPVSWSVLRLASDFGQPPEMPLKTPESSRSSSWITI